MTSKVFRFDLASHRISTLPPDREEALLVVTSRPYPYDIVEVLDISASIVSGRMLFSPTWTDEFDVAPSVVSGDLRTLLMAYGYWPAEEFDLSPSVLSGTLAVKLITYGYWPSEAMDMTPSIITGTLV